MENKFDARFFRCGGCCCCCSCNEDELESADKGPDKVQVECDGSIFGVEVSKAIVWRSAESEVRVSGGGALRAGERSV